MSSNHTHHSGQLPRGVTGLRRALLTVAILAGASLLTGCDKLSEKSPSSPPPPPPPPEVVVVDVAQRDVTIESEWLGTTDGQVNAEVRSRVQGYVQSQLYTEGAAVKAGDPLYKIDPRPFEAVLAQAKAELSKAQANQARTELEVARLTPLAPTGAVSVRELDNAIQDNLANKAMVLAAEAAVVQAELSLEYTNIIAPIDGVAGESIAQIGDLVGGPAGQTLTTISTLDPIRVMFPVSEQEYLRFTRELNKHKVEESKVPLTMLLSDGSEFGHKGQVNFINRQVASNTGTIQVNAVFPNPGNVLRPGQYARIRAATKIRPGALLVPQRCVNEIQGVRQVAVVSSEGTVSIRIVKTGERVGSDWIIEEGVESGDRVVIEGLQKIKDGMKVTQKLFDPPVAKKSAPQNSSAKNAKVESESAPEKKGH